MGLRVLLLFFSAVLFSIQVSAQSTPGTTLHETLQNTKEGKSRYLNWMGRWYLKRLEKENPTVIQHSLETFFQSLEKPCQYQLLFKFKNDLSHVDWKRSYDRNEKPLLYKARKLNLIDDVTLGLLLEARKDLSVYETRNRPQWYRKNYKGEDHEQYVQVYSQTEQGLEAGGCLAPLWSGTFSRLKDQNISTSDKDLRRSLARSFDEGKINARTYALLDMARRKDIEERTLTLSSYVGNLARIKRQYGEGEGTSDVVSKKIKEEKTSYRQRLYHRYNVIQIQLLSNLVDKMRVRLDAAEVAIEVRDENGGILEEILLDPLEQYRFAAKMVRKEMELLKTSSLMNGKAVSYMDLVTAAFETGLVRPAELAELAKIEEIWNPKEKLKDKILKFVKTYGGLTSVFLPPGYNLIPVVGILILEAFTSSQNRNLERNHALF